MSFNGCTVFSCDDINQAVQVKNLLEYSNTYSESLGQSMFHYPDTSIGAVSKEFNEIGDAVPAHTPTRSDAYDEGFAKRKALLAGSHTSLQLRRYGFFNSFQNNIAPNGKMQFSIEQEKDDNIVYQGTAVGAANDRKYIVTKMVMWVPRMVFNSKGENLYLSRYF